MSEAYLFSTFTSLDNCKMSGINLRIRFAEGQGVLKGLEASTNLETLINKR